MGFKHYSNLKSLSELASRACSIYRVLIQEMELGLIPSEVLDIRANGYNADGFPTSTISL